MEFALILAIKIADNSTFINAKDLLMKKQNTNIG